MIKSFIHKGLERFFRTGDTSGINKMYAPKIARVLSVLDELSDISQLKGLWQCHRLKGDRDTEWALSISGNWRITFEIKEGHVYIVNYEDYH